MTSEKDVAKVINEEVPICSDTFQTFFITFAQFTSRKFRPSTITIFGFTIAICSSFFLWLIIKQGRARWVAYILRADVFYFLCFTRNGFSAGNKGNDGRLHVG